MITTLLETTVTILFIIGFLLQTLHYGWFRIYTSLLASFVKIISGVVIGTILSTPTIVRGVIKAIFVSVVSIILVLVYSFTYLIPHLGNKAAVFEQHIRYSAIILYFESQVREMRDLMIRIVAEEDDRDLLYDEPEMYQSDLKQIKQNAKNKLELGETFLSILLGVSLILGNVIGLNLLQMTVFRFPVELLVEIWLLIISISIIYRSSVLEFLAFPSEYDFGSPEEMDAAVSYQKAASLVGFIQGLAFILMLTFSISRIRSEIVEDALRAKYTDEPWVRFTWEKLTN